MVDNKWRPSQEKFRRNVKLIDALENELRFFDYVRGQIVIGEGYAIKMYRDWKTEPLHYKTLIQTVRAYLLSRLRIRIGGEGYSLGYKLTAYDIEDQTKIFYKSLLEKFIERTYERMKKEAPSEEGTIEIVKEFDNQPHKDLLKDMRELRFRVGLADKDDIRVLLEPIILEYLKRKEAKLQQHQQERR